MKTCQRRKHGDYNRKEKVLQVYFRSLMIYLQQRKCQNYWELKRKDEIPNKKPS